jgi:inner membrane protein
LTGAAFAHAGLKRRTRFGSAALMIAANLPDVDVLAFVSDTPAVALRRGWTHGVIAQATLPVLLMLAFVLLDRCRPAATESPSRPSSSGPARVRPLAMLMLGYVGVLSHVAMDWLNTYGVRWLMPLSPNWFYGDSVFIVDPWLWITFGAGVFFSRRFAVTMPARVALIACTIYVAAMIVSATVARQRVVAAWTAAKGTPPRRVMVGPVPINPFSRAVIIDAGEYYERGSFEWWPTRGRDPGGADGFRLSRAVDLVAVSVLRDRRNRQRRDAGDARRHAIRRPPTVHRDGHRQRTLRPRQLPTSNSQLPKRVDHNSGVSSDQLEMSERLSSRTYDLLALGVGSWELDVGS